MAKKPRDLESLSTQHKLFISEYLIDLNASAAYMRAGYKSKTPDVNASQLLVRPRVRAAIQEALDARSKRTLVTQDMVINELRRIAFSNMGAIATWNPSGLTFKASEDLDDDAMATVQSVKETTNEHGGSLEIKQYDKMKALELLGKHLKLYTDKVEHSGTLSLEALVGAANKTLGEPE